MCEVHVAVGVILDKSNRVLISLRHDDAHQGGLWEFPGGKVEAGESVAQALGRELREELGITVAEISPLLEVRHDYGDKTVFLDVYTVRDFAGEARGLEGQPLRWVMASELSEYRFPAANMPITEAVAALLS